MPAKDPERDQWLDVLRHWGESLIDPERPELGTNWQRVNTTALESAAHTSDAYCLTRWWNRTARGQNKTEARISRDDFLRLCPWLDVWYGFEPPTNKYVFL